MKKIITHFCLVLAIAFAGVFTACNPKEIEDADTGALAIKSVLPTKVVAGQPMTLSGTGFGDVREVVFPDGITVSAIEHVGNGMIRVTAPAGISPSGGKLIVRTSDEQAEYKVPITLGNTVVSGYSKTDGEEIEGGQQLTVYGQDLEFICRAELFDPDGNPLIVEDELFYRKGTSSVIITIPRKILEGTWTGKIFTFDGKEFLLPELTYRKPSDGGHWETVKKYLWENPGAGEVAWSSQYRFGLEGHDGLSECITTFPPAIWNQLLTEPFYMDIEGANPNFRVTNGHWSVEWSKGDLGRSSELMAENEDGTCTVTIDLSGEADLVATLEEKHLLFTGSGYTPIGIFVWEEVWVDGGGDEGPKRDIFWENETMDGPADWGNLNYRFGLDGHDGNNECDATFPQELWDKIKTETFYALLEGANPQIRVTDGWWKANLTDDIKPGNDLLIDNGDGTWILVVNLTSAPALLDLLDAQHLLFTGQGYTLVSLFFQEGGPTPGGGGGGGDTPGGDTPIDMEGDVIWSQETAFADWSATIAIPAEKFANVEEGDIIRVYLKEKTGDFNPVFKHVEDWSDWSVFSRVDGDNYFEAAVPAEAIDELKEKGLRFQGVGFTVAGVTLIPLTPPIVPEGTILFDTETVFGDWSATCVVDAAKFADVKEGDTIRIYFKKKTDDFNPVFKHVEDWSDWPELQGAKEDAADYFQAVVPAAAVDELKEKGLRFQGVGFTLVYVTLIPGAPAFQPEGTILFDTETVFGDWSATCVIDPAKFANVKAGDTIRVYIKDKGGDYNAIFKHVEDWQDWAELQGVKEDAADYFQAVVPAAAVDELKEKGLRFQGVGYTIVAVTHIPFSVTLFDTETVFGDWSATCVVDAAKFADVKEGDTIRVFIKDKGADYNAIFKHVEDWQDWAELQGVKEDAADYFQAVVPAAAVDELKEKGLRFQGVGFTIVSVKLL